MALMSTSDVCADWPPGPVTGLSPALPPAVTRPVPCWETGVPASLLQVGWTAEARSQHAKS